VRANFLSLLNAVRSGTPLPLASIQNKRSLIFVENLADAIAVCLINPAASGQTYFVCDGAAVSTPALIHAIASTMGKQAHLIPVPSLLLNALGTFLGKTGQIQRLCESLEVSDAKFRTQLNWRPPFTLEQGLERTVRWYSDSREYSLMARASR
jgi:nucleoside-diphosphate-sugar epimerase